MNFSDSDNRDLILTTDRIFPSQVKLNKVGLAFSD